MRRRFRRKGISVKFLKQDGGPLWSDRDKAEGKMRPSRRQRRFELAMENRKVDHPRQPFQWIARRRQRLQALLAIKKSRLSRHRQSPVPDRMESAISPNGQRFLEMRSLGSAADRLVPP